MKRFVFRFLSMITGICLYSLGIVITIKANIGYSPWDVLHAGIAQTIGMSIGTVVIVVGLVILVLVVVLGEKFGFGTLSNMVMIGVLIDIILFLDFIPIAQGLIFGIPMLITGLFVISLAIYFYIKSGFGAGPRDNLMVVLSRKTKIPAGVCRCIIELLATFFGWLLGGMVGIGTVISVIAIGFCIQITFWALKFDVTSVKHETLRETFDSIRTGSSS